MHTVAINTIVSIIPDISVDGVSLVVKTSDEMFWRAKRIEFDHKNGTAKLELKS